MNTTVWRVWYKIEHHVDPAVLPFPFTLFLKPGWRHSLVGGKPSEFDSLEQAQEVFVKLPKDMDYRIVKVTEEVYHR